jgi:prohibitin 2
MRDFLLFFIFLVIVARFYDGAAVRVLRRGATALEPAAPVEGRRPKKSFNFASAGTIVKGLVLGVVVGLLVVILLSLAWVEVAPAETMAIYDPARGGIQTRDFSEGWHMVPPWVTKQYFSKRLQEYTMSIMRGEGAVAGDDSMQCQTKEGLQIKVDCTSVFRIPIQGAHTLWRNVGPDYIGRVVRPSTRNVVRLVIANYGIMEVYSNASKDYLGQPGVDFYIGRRKQIEQEIEQTLRKQYADKGLELVMFLLRNVAYDSPQYENSIVMKQIAQQAVTTQQYQAEAAKIRAQARIVRAEGEAKAIQLKAEALRIDPRVVSLEWVEQLNPEEVVIFPKGGIVPFVQLPGGRTGTMPMQ